MTLISLLIQQNSKVFLSTQCILNNCIQSSTVHFILKKDNIARKRVYIKSRVYYQNKYKNPNTSQRKLQNAFAKPTIVDSLIYSIQRRYILDHDRLHFLAIKRSLADILDFRLRLFLHLSIQVGMPADIAEQVILIASFGHFRRETS